MTGRSTDVGHITSIGLVLLAMASHAQGQDRFEGSAVIRTDDMEHVIPVVCDDAALPALGFSTEPSRITRETTGRSSPVNLRLRRWPNSDELVVTLDRYVAWIPAPDAQGPVLSLTISMSSASVVRGGVPVTLSHEMWTSGDRPEGIDVEIQVNCQSRDPAAPASRRLP